MIINKFKHINVINHELIQQYISYLYSKVNNITSNLTLNSKNEIYGEIYYYSLLKLLKYLDINQKDHFLDLGSGLGKIVFQVFLTTEACSVTGIEINYDRFVVSKQVKELISKQLSNLFEQKSTGLHRSINLIYGDFLKHSIYDFYNITVLYLCCTVFSIDLLNEIQTKIQTMPKLQKIISFKLLPNLTSFNLTKKFFLHGDWDYTTCYLYTKI